MMASRFRRGLAANAGNLAVRVGLQLVQVPLLLSFWSPETLGGWLLLWSLPSLSALGVLGLGAAAGNRLVSVTDRAQAAGVFRGTALALALTSLVLALAALATAMLWDGWRAFFAPDRQYQAGVAIVLLSLHLLASIWLSLLEAGYRHLGDYPRFVAAEAVYLALDVACILLLAWASDDYAIIAAGLLALRLASVAQRAVWLMGRAGYLFTGEARAPLAELRRIAAPSIAFFLTALVAMLNMQGWNLLVAAACGPVLLAAFVAMRTLLRVIDLPAGLLHNQVFYEAEHMQAERGGEVLAKAIVGVQQATLLIGAAGVLALWLAGDWIFSIYTRGSMDFPAAAFLLLTLAGALRLAMAPMGGYLTGRNLNVGLSTIALALTGAAMIAFALLAARLDPRQALTAAAAIFCIAMALRLMLLQYLFAHHSGIGKRRLAALALDPGLLIAGVRLVTKRARNLPG